MEVHQEIPTGPEAPAHARALVASLSSRVPERLLDEVRIVISELVTNSYQHAGNPEGTPIDVHLDLTEDRLRVEVIDGSIFDPTPETTKELRSAKWGLAVIDRVADSWGRISEGGIWVEFQLPT